MYSMTLEINQKCNLRCKYCYLGEKAGTQMKMEIAKKAIRLAFAKTKEHRDRTLWFDFVGGEPLIDFLMIEKLVAYIEEKNEDKYTLLFSCTTNATIFTDNILSFLIEKNFMLKISIDGDKYVNDKNRIAIGNYSVHDRILSYLPNLRKYEENTGRFIQVTNVITANNYENYYETLVYLTEVLGLRSIDTGIDLFVSWTDEQFEVLKENIRKSLDYFIEKARNNEGFVWRFFDNLMNAERKLERFVYCGAGVITSYVRTDGQIYGCAADFEERSRIGDVNHGFDRDKVQWIRQLNGIENTKCNSCELYDICTAKGCIMQSQAKNGTIHEPDRMLCRLVKYAYDLSNEYKDVLNQVVMKEGA